MAGPAKTAASGQSSHASPRKIFVANESGSTEIDGQVYIFHKGITRVREGHELIKAYPGFFDEIDLRVDYDVEQATAGPGEKRGG